MQGLINAVHELAPDVEHRHCARHIYANWRKKYAGDKYKMMFWNLVKDTLPTFYNYHLNLLREESNDVAEDFLAQNPTSFCKSLTKTFSQDDTVDNNICETFNSYMLRFRDKLLVDMLDGIRLRLMGRMHKLLQSVKKGKYVMCPRIRKKTRKKVINIKEYMLHAAATEGSLEVHRGEDRYIVDLVGKSCTCYSWQLTDLPCSHGLACIFHDRDNYENYVDKFYYKSNCSLLRFFPTTNPWRERMAQS